MLIPRCLAVSLLCSCLSACLVIDDYVKEVEQAGLLSPSITDTVSAIKLALEDGVDNSVSALGRSGGFYNDQRVRVPLPKELQDIESLLSRFGQQRYADEFVKTLNSAAEQAVPEATSVFFEAIRAMSVEDAVGIMRGGDSAATQYFRRVSSAQLREKFSPIVRRATANVGLTRAYKDLSQRLALVGFRTQFSDLDGYVTERALDGLFLYVAEQEAKIRQDPLGQSDALLRKVFGYYR